jgi:geranylgeranyl reductase
VGIQYWINKEFEDIEIHYDFDRFGPWYSWIAPHKGITSIGVGGIPRLISTKKIKENLIKWCAENDYDISDAKFEGAPINGIYQGYRFNDKFLIGDAAGFPSPLTGEGIYFAMASGEDVAKTIINKNHDPILIKKILDIRKKHEIILNTFKLNKTLKKMEYNLLFSLLEFKFFKNMMIDLVA